MLSHIVIAVLSLLGSYASAAPPIKRTAYPVGVVRPGPGLPSLESLGLTNEDLYDPNYLSKRGIVLPSLNSTAIESRQAIRYCTSGPPAEVANINACQNYLASLGTTRCVAPSSGVEMCRASGADGTIYPAHVIGTARCSGTDSSYCSDVAPVAGFVIDQCNWFWNNSPHWVAAGGDAARGNGCLQIDVLGDR